MNKHPVLIVVLLLASVAVGWAASARSTLGPGFGLAYLEVRDDQVIPLRFVGPHLTVLRPAYGLYGEKYRLAVDAGIGLAPLFDRYGFIVAMFPLDAACRCLTRVADNGRGGVFVGGQARWAMDLDLPEFWDNEHTYWLTAIELAPAAAYVRQLKENSELEVSAALPLVSFVSRPPLRRYSVSEPDDIGFFFRTVHQDLQFATLNRYQSAQVSVAWRKLGHENDFTVAYRGRFVRASWQLPIIEIEHSLNLTWEFGL
jgi:hypothetical protein